MQTYFILTYNVVSVTGNGKRAGRPSSTLLLRVTSHLRRLCSPQRRPGNRVRREARFRGLKCHLRLATGLPATGLPRDSRLLRPRGETRARGRSERAHAMPSAPTAFRKINERAGVDLGPDAAEAAGERPPRPPTLRRRKGQRPAPGEPMDGVWGCNSFRAVGMFGRVSFWFLN